MRSLGSGRREAPLYPLDEPGEGVPVGAPRLYHYGEVFRIAVYDPDVGRRLHAVAVLLEGAVGTGQYRIQHGSCELGGP